MAETGKKIMVRNSGRAGQLLQVLVLGALILSASAATVWAHKGATGVVKTRMHAMKALKKDLKFIRDMLNGKQDFSNEQLLVTLTRISGHTGPAMLKLFPKNSTQKPSEADPAIWTNWSEFTTMAAELQGLSISFQSSIEAKASSEKLKSDYLKLRAGCKSCHDRFRE